MFMPAELPNFVHLAPTLTKLRNTKCNHLMNVYISLEKREKLQYICIS